MLAQPPPIVLPFALMADLFALLPPNLLNAGLFVLTGFLAGLVTFVALGQGARRMSRRSHMFAVLKGVLQQSRWLLAAAAGLFVASVGVGEGAEVWLQSGAMLSALLALGVLGACAADEGIARLGQHLLTGKAKDFPVLRRVARGLVWALVGLAMLSEFGVDITSIVAGLGIGGLAVAIASQKILGDLFASLSLSLDRPFSEGDYISAAGVAGTVEHIGLKTTRIRTLAGEEVAIANAQLTDAEIRNFSRALTRRVELKLGVEYSTSPKTLQDIPNILKNIVNNTAGTKLVRCRFFDAADSALVFLLVFDVQSGDYDQMLEKREQVLYQAMEKITAAGASFAFPTRTVHIQRDA